MCLALNGSAGCPSARSRQEAERLAALFPSPPSGTPLRQALRTFDLTLPAVGLAISGARVKMTLPREARLSAPNGV
ncbi:hypothetical protein, partial [Sphingomonas koreensis]|uniref:hypothetical protein n=1 Tax=Sphingomonas koreensis TaxID=93064 RepID=UPI0019CFED04